MYVSSTKHTLNHPNVTPTIQAPGCCNYVCRFLRKKILIYDKYFPIQTQWCPPPPAVISAEDPLFKQNVASSNLPIFRSFHEKMFSPLRKCWDLLVRTPPTMQHGGGHVWKRQWRKESKPSWRWSSNTSYFTVSQRSFYGTSKFSFLDTKEPKRSVEHFLLNCTFCKNDSNVTWIQSSQSFLSLCLTGEHILIKAQVSSLSEENNIMFMLLSVSWENFII